MDLQRQNILFLTRTMGVGGTENVIIQLCEALKAKVNKIVVCSCGGVNVGILTKMGIKHCTIPDMGNKKPLEMIHTYIKVKGIIKEENITVIHAHHRMAALYAKLCAPEDIARIVNAHNTFLDKKRLTRYAYKNTNLIAVGETVKKNLTDFYGIPESKVSVIRNASWPFDGEIKEIDEIIKARKHGYILIGNIGRLSEQKGMSYFIEAAEIVRKTHPETRFYIIGDGEERKQLEHQVEEKDMEDFVIFLGYRSDIQNAISQLDFIVLSSLWEGLPLTPIEAYSVGRTVIGTAIEGTAEIIRNGVDGFLVEPKDPKAIAEKIIYLVENPEVKIRMDIEARKRYEEEFSFEKLANAYIGYYEGLKEC